MTQGGRQIKRQVDVVQKERVCVSDECVRVYLDLMFMVKLLGVVLKYAFACMCESFDNRIFFCRYVLLKQQKGLLVFVWITSDFVPLHANISFEKKQYPMHYFCIITPLVDLCAHIIRVPPSPLQQLTLSLVLFVVRQSL